MRGKAHLRASLDSSVSCSNKSIKTAPNHLLGSPRGSIVLLGEVFLSKTNYS